MSLFFFFFLFCQAIPVVKISTTSSGDVLTAYKLSTSAYKHLLHRQKSHLSNHTGAAAEGAVQNGAEGEAKGEAKAGEAKVGAVWPVVSLDISFEGNQHNGVASCE